MTRERNTKQEEEWIVTGEMTNRQMHYRRITIDILIPRRKKRIIEWI